MKNWLIIILLIINAIIWSTTMTGEEQFITAIIEQAIEDCAYTGTSAKKDCV